MLPSSLLLYTLTLLAPLVAATSPPICTPSVAGADITDITTSYTSFCKASSANNSTSLEKISDTDFTYTKNGAGCSEDDCLKALGSLMQTCELNNHTITGGGNIEIGCGAYGFAIGGADSPANTTVTPAPSQTGKPNVGSTALGTSGASLVKISGSLMVGVAGIFVCFL